MTASIFLRTSILSLAAFTFSASAAIVNLEAFLDGAQEAPTPVVTPATGSAQMTYDDDTNLLTWNIDFVDLLAGLSDAHFHGNAPVGVSVGVKIPIPHTKGVLFGNLNGSAAVDEADEAALLGGLWYINIHSEDFRAGEIRGQVNVVPGAIPEPSTVLLFGTGFAGFLAIRRFRRS